MQKLLLLWLVLIVGVLIVTVEAPFGDMVIVVEDIMLLGGEDCAIDVFDTC